MASQQFPTAPTTLVKVFFSILFNIPISVPTILTGPDHTYQAGVMRMRGDDEGGPPSILHWAGQLGGGAQRTWWVYDSPGVPLPVVSCCSLLSVEGKRYKT